MDETTIVYIAASILVAILVFTASSRFGIFGIIIDALAGLTVILILLLAFADFLLLPVITRLLGITITPAKNFTITSSQDSVIKYSNGIYYATGYLTANVYNYIFTAERSVDDRPELIAAPEKWEKAIMNLKFPFKFNLIAASEDIQKYRDELETKRGLLEFQYSKEMQSTNPNPMGLENMQREINVIQTRIDKIGEGEKPVNSIMYLESTAVGVSLKDAQDALSNQLSELQTVFNVFDLSLIRVTGREVYSLFSFNYIIPNEKEMFTIFNTQN